jgi:hypothetical protein
MKSLALLLILMLSYKIALAQGGWFWQNPLPQGNDLRDVWVLN